MSIAEAMADLLDLDPARYAWRTHGACRQHPELDFFPGRDESTRQQKQVCAGCPVRDICLEVALASNDQHGIWGGMSERERRRLRKTRRLDTGADTEQGGEP